MSKLRAGADVRGTVSTIQLDVTDDKSVDAAAEKVTADYSRLDILANNTVFISLADLPSPENYREVLNTNVVGALSSKCYSGNGFEYRSSNKAALNMLVVLCWSHLQKEGFKVLGVDPGLCGTNFTSNHQSLPMLAVFLGNMESRHGRCI